MESISRISSLLETARDLTLEAAQQAGPRRSTKPLPAQQIKKLLDSRNERDVLDGLRRVIAMQYAQPPQATLTFFPAVLKTLSNPYPSTRPLVYNYLIHHAEADPDTALLAINTIQKSLSDSNPRIRAMALKTMSGIRVPVISQIVSLAIKKGVSDLSPLVRKAAALSCVKCVRLDPSARPQVEEYLAALLADKQYYVAGAAVQAFMEIYSDRLDLIHPVYRRLCKMMVDMDEWGQLAILRLMTVYARQCFPHRTKSVKRAAQTQEQKSKDFYEDLEPEESEADEYEDVNIVDPDLTLFLTSTQPLLQSRNSAVIIAVTRAYLYLSPATHLQHAIGPLIALLRSPQDIQQTALYNIVQVALHDATLFVPDLRHFLLKASEPPEIWRLKLEIMTLVFPHSDKETQDLILAELEHFSHSANAELVRESVRAIGRCAQSSSTSSRTSRRCLSLLLKQIHSADENLVGESIEVVRHMIQRSPDDHRKTVIRLAKNLDTLTSSVARANVVWLVGEFAGYEPESNIAADVLRILVKGYADESEAVKGQIVLLAARVYLHYLNSRNAKQKALDALNPPTEQQSENSNSAPDYGAPDEDNDRGFRDDAFSNDTAGQADQKLDLTHPIELLYTHTLLLARYTPSYDLRDRARTYRALLSTPSSTDLASLLLLAPKPVPQAPSPSQARKTFVLGSASLIVGEALRGDEGIPDWVREGEEPDARLRDDGVKENEYVAGRSTATASAGQRLDEALAADPGYKSAGVAKKEKSLDAWLDEEESEESESEETESGEEDEESEYETDSEDDEQAGLVQ